MKNRTYEGFEGGLAVFLYNFPRNEFEFSIFLKYFLIFFTRTGPDRVCYGCFDRCLIRKSEHYKKTGGLEPAGCYF